MSSITISRGQTLSGLVNDYNRQHGTRLTVNQVARANGIADPNKIYAGNTLRFTDSFEPSRTTATRAATRTPSPARDTFEPSPSTSSTGGLQRRPGQPAYQALADFARARGFTVTSTTGGSHDRNSAHYQGRAVDVRTRDHSRAEVDAFIRDARAAGIRVFDERTPRSRHWSGPHLHLSLPN